MATMDDKIKQKVAHSFFAGHKEEAIATFKEIKATHLGMARQLLIKNRQ